MNIAKKLVSNAPEKDSFAVFFMLLRLRKIS